MSGTLFMFDLCILSTSVLGKTNLILFYHFMIFVRYQSDVLSVIPVMFIFFSSNKFELLIIKKN